MSLSRVQAEPFSAGRATPSHFHERILLKRRSSFCPFYIPVCHRRLPCRLVLSTLMNLSGFQLDAINDLEMLRSLACDQTLDEHYHPQQQSPHHHNRPGAQRTSSNDMHTFSESIDELLNSSGGANANGDDLNSFINALQQSTTSVIHAQRKLSMMAAAHSSAPSPHSAYKAAVSTPHQTSHTDYFEEVRLCRAVCHGKIS